MLKGKMRLFFAAAVVAVILALSNESILAQSSEVAHLYLHPTNKDQSSNIQLTAPIFDEILSNHLNIYDNVEKHGAQRTVILFSGIDASDLNKVIPSKLQNIHTLSSPPHISSFEALMEDYGQKLYKDQNPSQIVSESTERFAGLIENAAEEVENALHGATNWLFGAAQNAAGLGKKLIDETDLATDEISHSFYQSLKNLVVYLDTIGNPTTNEEEDAAKKSAYQSLRFSGLAEIKAAYGEDSQQYKRAIESLRNLLQAAVERMEVVNEVRPQTMALIFVPESKDDGQEQLAKRSDPLIPFRGKIGHTPFLASRDVQKSERQVAFAKPSKVPSEGQLSGQCFTSEDDLNKATQNCSDRGKAVQTSKGGRKCYRCQCKKTDGKEWAGSACQRVDIAKPFALLAVTTIGLVLVALWSVLFLVYEGQNELPSVLAGITIPKK